MFLNQTSAVVVVSPVRSAVSLWDVCASRLVSTASLAAPTFGSAAGRRSPLARPTGSSSGWTSSPLARPNTDWVTGRAAPWFPCDVSPGVIKPLARPIPGPSIESDNNLLRPTTASWGSSALPRPNHGTPAIPLSSWGFFGSISQMLKWQVNKTVGITESHSITGKDAWVDQSSSNVYLLFILF